MPSVPQVPSDESRLNNLIGLIYESAIEDVQWHSFLTSLRGTYPGIACAIAGFSFDTAVPIFTQVGFDAIFIEEYAANANLINDTVQYMIDKPVGEVFGYTIVPPEEYWNLNLVKNWLMPQGFGPSSMSVLVSSGERFLAVNIAYPLGSDDTLRFAVEDTLRVLVPHIIRAMEIARKAAQNKIVSYSLKGLCDAISLPMLVTDQTGRLVFSNGTGKRFLAMSEDVRISPTGNVSGRTAGVSSDLRNRIAHVARSGKTSGLMLNSRSDNLAFCILPLSLDEASQTSLDAQLFGVTRLVGLLICQRRAAVLDPFLLRDVFGLSNAEAQICGYLMMGCTPEIIAKKLTRSVRTVRNHIQSIYAKCDVSSQNSLADALGAFRLFGTMVEETGNFA